MKPLGRNQAVKLMLEKFKLEHNPPEHQSPFWLVITFLFRLHSGKKPRFQ